MNKYVKYGLYATAAYVAYKLATGTKLSELLKFQFLNRGSEGSASTQAIGGKNVTLANAPTASVGGANVSGDGSSGFQPSGASRSDYGPAGNPFILKNEGSSKSLLDTYTTPPIYNPQNLWEM